MSDDTHGKLLAFLISSLSRTGTETAIRVEIEFRPPNDYRPEMLKRWTREADPDFFIVEATAGADKGTEGGPSNMAFVESMVTDMLEIAANHADNLPGTPGKRRFVVRVVQHYGTRLTHSFVMQPSFASDEADSERALTAPIAGTLEAPSATGLVSQLMRHLESKDKHTERMMGEFLKAVAHQGALLREENTELRERLAQKDSEFSSYRKQLDEAASLQHERDIEAQRVVASEERKTFAVKKVSALFPVIVSRLATPALKEGEAPKTPANPSELAQIVQRFLISLSNEQKGHLTTALAPEQLMVLAEVGRVITQHGDSPMLAQMLGEMAETLSGDQLVKILTPLEPVQRDLFAKILSTARVPMTARQPTTQSTPAAQPVAKEN